MCTVFVLVIYKEKKTKAKTTVNDLLLALVNVSAFSSFALLWVFII